MEPKVSHSPSGVASLADEAQRRLEQKRKRLGIAPTSRQAKRSRGSDPAPDLMAHARAMLDADNDTAGARDAYRDTLLPEGEIVLVGFDRPCVFKTVQHGQLRLMMVGHIMADDGTLGREILLGMNPPEPGRRPHPTSAVFKAFRAVVTQPIKIPRVRANANLTHYVDAFLLGVVVRCKTSHANKGSAERYSVVGDGGILELVGGTPPIVAVWKERLQ